MIIVPQTKNILSFEEARVFVRKELDKLAASPAVAECYPLVIRIEVPIVQFSVLDWLAQQEMLPRSYWGERDGSAAYAGVGSAWEDFARDWGDGEDVWTDVAVLLASEETLRVFAGMCFHRTITGDEWRSFKSIRFFVPRFEVVEDGRGTRFVCNVILGEGEKLPLRHVLKELESLRMADMIMREPLQVLARSGTPNFEQWSLDVAAALEDIRSGTIDKAVLCRRVTLTFNRGVDPVDILQHLLGMPPGGYAFLYQFSAAHAFLGVSPEVLYDRRGDVLCSEAIAGTRSRGSTEQEDAQWGRELLVSDKDMREHRSAMAALVAAFRQVCRSYTVDDKVSVVKLPYQQLLVAHISGTLAEGVTDRDLCATLHPAPEVGGSPADKALRFLHRVEGFDRGWFASPVGYFQKTSARMAVAVRSCLAAGEELHLYSGAGIVDGSRPLAEWDEMEVKIRQYLDIFYTS